MLPDPKEGADGASDRKESLWFSKYNGDGSKRLPLSPLLDGLSRAYEGEGLERTGVGTGE